MTGPVVAICGKGGVGKTTVAALVSSALADGERGRILAVDADPAGGLTLALGLQATLTLDQLRQELIDQLQGLRGPGDPGELSATADYRLAEALVERGSLALLAVGRPEEEGCYCKLNSFLRDAVETLARQFDLTLVDAEAGIEQVNRRVMRSVTHLLLVSDPSQRGLRVAETIHKVLRTNTEARVGLLINRADEAMAAQLAKGTSLPLLGAVPEDPAVRTLDLEGRSLSEIPEDSPSRLAVQALLDGPFFG